MHTLLLNQVEVQEHENAVIWLEAGWRSSRDNHSAGKWNFNAHEYMWDTRGDITLSIT